MCAQSFARTQNNTSTHRPSPYGKLGSVRCFGSDGRNGDVGGAPSVRFRVKTYYMSGKTALYGNYGSVSGKTVAK